MNYALKFAGTTSSYAKCQPFTIPTNAFTLYLAVRNTNVTTNAGFFSYASSQSDNAILIIQNTYIDILIAGNTYTTNFTIKDNITHIITVAWERTTGLCEVYLDGIFKCKSVISKGITLVSGGCCILGQDQDAVGGSFQSSQSLNGTLDELKIYSVKHNADKIAMRWNRTAILSDEGLNSYYRFDEGTGTKTYNLKNTSLNVFTLIGVAWVSSEYNIKYYRFLIKDGNITETTNNGVDLINIGDVTSINQSNFVDKGFLDLENAINITSVNKLINNKYSIALYKK